MKKIFLVTFAATLLAFTSSAFAQESYLVATGGTNTVPAAGTNYYAGTTSPVYTLNQNPFTIGFGEQFVLSISANLDASNTVSGPVTFYYTYNTGNGASRPLPLLWQPNGTNNASTNYVLTAATGTAAGSTTYTFTAAANTNAAGNDVTNLLIMVAALPRH